MTPPHCQHFRLAARFPNVDVKGAPTVGWFFPAALPGDLAEKSCTLWQQEDGRPQCCERETATTVDRWQLTEMVKYARLV